MAFKHSTDKVYTTKYGEPYLWGSGDVTTLPSNENKITASDNASGDNFGQSVAVGCGRIVVGAYGDDDNGTNSGAAYIFDLDGTQLAKITTQYLSEEFGYSVAVGCGRIVVGARLDDDNGTNSGAAHIFDLDGTVLTKITAEDPGANDQFGRSVAVGDNRIVVGAPNDDDNGTDSGSVYIFDLDGNQLTKITASDGAAGDDFGSSVAVGCGRIVVGAYGDDDNGTDSGSAYIFDLDGNQLAKITVPDGLGASNATTFGDKFGYSVAVSSGRIVVGSYNDAFKGSAFIFDLDGNQLAKLTDPNGKSGDLFGWSVAVGNGRIVVASPNDDDNGLDSGTFFVFDLDGNQLTKVFTSDNHPEFASSVAVGSGRIVVGGPAVLATDAVYIYETPKVYTPYDLIYNEV